MIHRRKGRKLKRTASHRASLFRNLSVSLIQNKKITTTLAKAKELRGYIDKLVTKSKLAYANADDKAKGVHQRRIAEKLLKDRTALKILFDEIAPKVSERPGGYTRVLKLGRRLGDAAEMAIIEFVDYNEAQAPKTGETTTKKKSASAKKKISAKGIGRKKKTDEKEEKPTPKTRKKKKEQAAE